MSFLVLHLMLLTAYIQWHIVTFCTARGERKKCRPELRLSLLGPNQAYSKTTLIRGGQNVGGNSYSYSYSTNRRNHGRCNRFESGVQNNDASGASRIFLVYTPTCDMIDR